jgi:hypothetical protein
MKAERVRTLKTKKKKKGYVESLDIRNNPQLVLIFIADYK